MRHHCTTLVELPLLRDGGPEDNAVIKLCEGAQTFIGKVQRLAGKYKFQFTII
ncbi:MAG: hypothetical protein RLZZ324_435 [Candidatus Parcubacteria bacterium]|jgi:hypothetical protein